MIINPKPFIATPCYNGIVSATFATSIAATAGELSKAGLDYTTSIVTNYDTVTGRNILLAHFMASEYTHLFFIDADMGWHPSTFLRLLAANHEISCGVYPKKTDPTKEKEWTFVPYLDEEAQIVQHPQSRFVRVKKCGTGFLCISREAILQIIESRKVRTWNSNDIPNGTGHWLFAVEPDETGNVRTEDFYFCDLFDGPIWADPEGKFFHDGNWTWHGGIGELLQRVVADIPVGEFEHA